MALTAIRKGAAASAVLAVVAVLSLAFASVAHCAPRVALVVGNGGYDPSNISRLANPVNDARLMAVALETVGFEVTLETDAGQDEMKRAIKAFGRRLRAAGSDAVGLFYYAGHGVEAGGSNYLIPLSAEVESAMDLASDAVPAQWVLSRMEAAGNRLNMVILDACRNNPYAGRVRGGGRGLARMDAPSGSLIAYSAGPGQVAGDGEGENSPYTRALAGALVEPGLKVEDVFKRVRVRVEEETGRTESRQTPWESSSLRGDFYFVAPAEVDEEPAPVAGGGTPVANEAKDAYEIAERQNTVAAYRAVVEHFPGFYATLARQRIEELEAAAVAAERRTRRQALAEKLGREFSPDAVGENGWTDLHWAAALELPGLAKELVEQGMDVDVRLDESGEAFGDSLKRTLRELGRDFDRWASDGETPLHLAVSENALSVADYLLGQGADVNAKTSNGSTPLHFAALRNALGLAKLLVGHGADVNAKTKSGVTVLHRAAKWSLSVVEYLVGQGADVNAKRNNGWTVLHAAAKKGSLSVVEYLVGHGADVNAKTNDGATVLHVAAASGSLSVVEYLVGLGADVNAKTNDGATVLHWAASGSLSVVEYLVGLGADVNAKTNDGATVLHWAASGSLSVVEYLVGLGADVNAKTNDGETPLHRATRYGPLSIAEFLVGQGADVDAKGKNGTPLDIATDNNRHRVAAFLRRQVD